jgi:hypothetical protein
MNLGKIKSQKFKFRCGIAGCSWAPADGKLSIRGVAPHFKEEHPGQNIFLLAYPQCSCGAWMDFTYSRPTGGARSKDYFQCSVCENTAFVIVEMGDEPEWRKTPV